MDEGGCSCHHFFHPASIPVNQLTEQAGKWYERTLSFHQKIFHENGIMLNVLAIMIGGSLGAICRHGMFLLVQTVSGEIFPTGTLAVNLCGSFLIGLLWSIFDRLHLSHEMRLFIFTGFLGGFTTFSTFTRETTQLIKTGAWKTALIYVSISNIAGVALVICGFLVAKRLPLGR
jgi:CrcB protein